MKYIILLAVMLTGCSMDIPKSEWHKVDETCPQGWAKLESVWPFTWTVHCIDGNQKYMRIKGGEPR